MTMTDYEARRRLVLAAERIADALEAANTVDPLYAIQKALEAKQEHFGAIADELLKHTDDATAVDGERLASIINDDPNRDMPPHIKRLIGVE